MADRQPSLAALMLLKTFERGPRGGFAPMAYRDPAGVLTIGWGHRIQGGERFRQPMTEAEAETLFRQDLERVAPSLAAALRNRTEVTQSMFDALCCLAFNVGLGRVLGSTLLLKLKAKDWMGAADEFLCWNKATNPETGKKETSKGLIRRRQAERELFLRDGVPS